MTSSIVIGAEPNGADVCVDIQELLATRLLVQGNSGSGKSHLLRRLLEESAGLVQQVVIDPEGDFVTLAEPFGHLVVDGSGYGASDIARVASRVRQQRASVVLALDGLEIEAQMRCAAQFLGALFDAPRDIWYPVLVVVDEAQVFAPAAAGDVSDEVRRISLAAMTNLMCRGRKRGLAGVIATQRLAKLAKNVAAEASNFLMGRTFLDIDMARAADLLGMERRQAEQIRDLERGSFLALGPAISRRPVPVRIGGVRTSSRATAHDLLPLPQMDAAALNDLLKSDTPVSAFREPPAPEPAPPAAETLLADIDRKAIEREEDTAAGQAAAPPDKASAGIAEILMEMAAEEDTTFQPAAALYQDFMVRCRIRRISPKEIDLATFRRKFAMAVAGIADEADHELQDVLRLSRKVPEELLAPFLAIAKAASENAPCPDEQALARVYGTRSPGRVRRLLDYLEKSGLIVVRTDFGGRRSVVIPEIGIATAPAA